MENFCFIKNNDIYIELSKSVKDNMDFYIEEENSNNQIPEMLTDCFLTSGLPCKEIQLINCKKDATNEEKCLNDIENIKIVYGNWKDYLTPLVANNRLLWTYLSHFEFKNYINSRWKNNNRNETTVKTRFFVNNLFDNAISRLWWLGKISYDECNKNPFHLTEILLTGQQICTDLLDESYSNNPKILKAMLLSLELIKERNKDAKLSIPWRNCVKKVNRYGAVVNLDYLEIEEITKIAYEFLNNELKK